MITLHHLENSRSIRILWLLEELGIEFKLEHFGRDRTTDIAKEEFKSLHVLGKAPLITDGELVIAESGAIIEYILDSYGNGKLRPQIGTSERIKYNYWMHAAEGSLMNLNTLALILNRMDAKSPLIIKPIIKAVTRKVREGYLNANMTKLLAHMEAELEADKWFSGTEFTAADIQMGYVMLALEVRGGMNSSHVNCKRWIRQMNERPAFQTAMEKNGPLVLLES